MSKNVLFLIVGVIIGAAVTALVTKDPGDLPEVRDGESVGAIQGNVNLPTALAEIQKLKAENRTLKVTQSKKPKQMVALFPKQDANPGAAQAQSVDRLKEDEQETDRPRMEDRLLSMMENRIQSRITRLKAAIKMSDEQSGVVEAYLRERGAVQMEYRKLRFSGELTPEQEAEYTEKLQEMGVGNFLKDNLSAEQYAEYDQFLQEQNQAELASYASRQISNLVQTVRLTDEQKDQAYQAFYQEAYNSIPEGEEFSAGRRMFGPEAADNMQTQLIALEGILNEEQMSAYRTQVESRVQAIQNGGGRPRGLGGSR